MLKMFLSSAALFLFSGCHSGPELVDRPACSWKLWAADSVQRGITRAQDKITIGCASPEFDEYVCLSKDSFRNLMSCGK